MAAVNPPTPEFDRLADDSELPFVPLEAVWPSGVDASRRKIKATAISGYTRFIEGDIVVPKITPTFQADRSTIVRGISGGVAAGTTELHVVRVHPGVDARFVRYLFSTRPFLHGGEAEMIGVAGQKRVPDEWLRNLPVRVTEPAVQRRIADYLDTETSRIDALVARKQQMLMLVREHLRAFVSEVIWTGAPQQMPLMHRTQDHRPIMYGIVLPGPSVEAGVPIVKGGDVAAQRLRLADLNRTTAEIEAPYARARLQPGDLVFTIRGGIGDVEITPPELEGANITQDVARVAPAARVDPEWLRLALSTFRVQADVERRTTGATIKGINIGELKHVGVPASDPSRQAEDLAALRPAISRHDRMTSALERQVRLLAEHRQALITAAVSGRLEILETEE